jgi:autotransporter-associated beta strand protein
MKKNSRNILLAALLLGQSQAAVISWDGGGVGATQLETPANWTGDVLPSIALPDTALFDGTVSGSLALVYNTGLGGAAGNLGLNLNLSGGQTSPLSIDSATNTAIRMNNVTLDSLSGAFTLGNGTGTGATGFAITLGGATNQTHVWTNNSAAVATIQTDVLFGLGGGAIHALQFTGSGNWDVKNNLTVSNAATAGVQFGLQKLGAGTLTLSGGGSFKAGPTALGGAFGASFKDGVTNVTAGNYAFNASELVVGGLDVTGTNTQLNLSNAGSLTGLSWLSLGRGNGAGAVTSSLTLNNTSSITAADMSGGFNAGNAATAPKVVATLNDSSSLTITTNVQIGESANSDVTVNVNGTSTFSQTATGAGSARLGIGAGAKGTLNVNGGTVNIERDLIVGAGGIGAVNLSSGSINVAGAGAERWLIVGNAAGATTGSLTVSGGNLNLNRGTDLRLGNINGQTGANVVTLSGGTITGYVGNKDGGFSTTSVIDLNRINANAAANNTFNLNGGTLYNAGIESSNNTGLAAFNFNGGQLIATGTGTGGSFLNLGGVDQKAYVLAGGAKINTNGFDITFVDPLLDGTAGAGGGGLIKSGSGKLTLPQTGNTFTGNVQVLAGTLVAGVTYPGSLTIANGATVIATGVSGTNDSVTMANLSLNGGGNIALELSSTVKDTISTGNLDITNGKITLYSPSTTNPTADSGGPYTLINYTGTLTGSVSSLSVANPFAGYNYTFADTGTAITLTITFTDTDSDGMPDLWETANGLNPAVNDAGGNADGDFSTNLQEFLANTNPQSPTSDPLNTDNDGILDSWEMSFFANLTAATATSDYDGDLATDLQEFIADTGSDASHPKSADSTDSGSFPDSDADGINDAWEVKYFGSITAKDGTADSDSDGITDLAEFVALSSPEDVNWNPSKAKLIHRWSFNGDLTDSIASDSSSDDPYANSPATVVDLAGVNPTQNATDITLVGGANGTADYISLGGNLLNGRPVPVTIQGWATQRTVLNWARIWDFGSSTASNMFMSFVHGTNNSLQRNEWNQAGYPLGRGDTNLANLYALNTKMHYAFIIEPGKGTDGSTLISVYVGAADAVDLGSPISAFSTSANLRNFVDSLNTLGRSFYTGDNVANASYDEFRIFHGALTSTERELYHDLGPDLIASTDTDSDGLEDTWEMVNFGNLDEIGTGDPDGDGFDNETEETGKSNPSNISITPVDLDGDGMLDAWEVTHFGSVVARNDGAADFDGDLLTNAQESDANTNPKNASTVAGAGNFADSDSDGMNDAWEVKYFGDLSAKDGTVDTDSDGATDLAEYVALSSPTDATWTPTMAKLIHQWTFNANSLADSIATNTSLVDAHTNSPATVTNLAGADPTFSAEEITMAGGANATSDYLQIGSNLLNGKASPVTIQLWVTQRNTGTFSRVFDFGTGTGGTNFYVSFTRGADLNLQRNEWNSPQYGATTADTAFAGLYALNTKKHVAAVVEPGKGVNGTTLVSLYVADASATDLGAAISTFSTANNFRNFTDVANYLGRSFYGGDLTANASYDEVRIYDGALTSVELEATHDLGPVAPAQPYLAWAVSKGLSAGDALNSADPDNDGMINLMEYFLDGSPTSFTAAPAASIVGANLSISFKRRDDAEADVTSQFVRVSTDLVNWTDVAIPTVSSTVSGVTFTVSENGAAADDVTASVAKGSDVKKFLGVKVIEN